MHSHKYPDDELNGLIQKKFNVIKRKLKGNPSIKVGRYLEKMLDSNYDKWTLENHEKQIKRFKKSVWLSTFVTVICALGLALQVSRGTVGFIFQAVMMLAPTPMVVLHLRKINQTKSDFAKKLLAK